MKLSTIALAGALAMSSTFAFAQMDSATGTNNPTAKSAPTTMDHGMKGTTGMGHGQTANPNGSPNGPTSLSGTGPSTAGGEKPGATTGNR